MTRTKANWGRPIIDRGVRPGVILIMAAVVQFLAPLDLSIVNVALLQIGVGFGFSAVGLTWVINAYALTFGGLCSLARHEQL